MLAFLAHWKLYVGATAAIFLVGYVGVLNVQIAAERATVAMLDADLRTEQGKYLQCDADLVNLKERIASDALVPDDLGGFTAPPWWMLPDFHPGSSGTD